MQKKKRFLLHDGIGWDPFVSDCAKSLKLLFNYIFFRDHKVFEYLNKCRPPWLLETNLVSATVPNCDFFLLRETILIQGFQFFINQRRFLEFWLIAPFHSQLGITSSDEIVQSYESFLIRVCTWLLVMSPISIVNPYFSKASQQIFLNKSCGAHQAKYFPFSVLKGKVFFSWYFSRHVALLWLEGKDGIINSAGQDRGVSRRASVEITFRHKLRRVIYQGESCGSASWATTARRTVSHLRTTGQVQVRNGDSPTKQNLLFRLCLCISVLALVSVNQKDDGKCVRWQRPLPVSHLWSLSAS